MTKQELNRDIKRLYSLAESAKVFKDDLYHNFIENNVRPEFNRLYHADSTAEYMNLLSLKIMIRLNHKFRFIQLHLMFINIKI